MIFKGLNLEKEKYESKYTKTSNEEKLMMKITL